jgi:SAM-dependent methyltransferase
MIEWTGERFVPWLQNATIAYEHLHRYAYAAGFVKDKRVLDLAAGEGYGSQLLARTAAAVVGVDIDPRTVRHATQKYGTPTIQFIPGSAAAVPLGAEPPFDVVVCFEAIEHIEDQQALLREVARLLAPDGLFIASTPNAAEYRSADEEPNPFHVKELQVEEFRQLLAGHFAHVRLLGQRVLPCSSIWPLGSTDRHGMEEFLVSRGDSEFELVAPDRRAPLYWIALASNAAAAPSSATESVLIDASDSLTRWGREELLAQREGTLALQRHVGELERVIASLETAVRSLRGTVQWREAQVRDLTAALEWTRTQIPQEQGMARHADPPGRPLGDRLVPAGSARRRALESLIALLRPRASR